MAITTSTSPGISQRTNVHAAREMLEHAEPVLVLRKSAKHTTMPKNDSRTVSFRRPVPFTAKTTPLTEGTTPSSTAFAYEDVSVTINQYGDWTEITDVIEDTHEDPVLNDAAMMQGENMGRTWEALDWAVLRAGTNVQYANGTARNQVNTAITLNTQRAIVRTLTANKARRITRVAKGSVKINTTPVESGWLAFGHSDLESDIRGLSGFRPVSEYGGGKTICDEEIGKVENVRYILSPDLTPFADAGGAAGGNFVSTSGTSADVYPLMFVGQDAWGCVELAGANAMRPIIIPVDTMDKSDPLNQRGTVGWKGWHAAIRLNETWMVRAEVAATAL